ncbi:hypothetical protein SESBI_46246 [Sesbania bispinosa]|nr:hypothetical protein SESBI_46246 [Sesbania bispinosa]
MQQLSSSMNVSVQSGNVSDHNAVVPATSLAGATAAAPATSPRSARPSFCSRTTEEKMKKRKDERE